MRSDPNNYWSQDRTLKSQRLYVGFCEFASASLDYATGLDLLRRGAGGAARLNWSSTASYYSLVHAARFVVFAPIGDFPKSHDRLQKCFDTGNPVKTNWLKDFLRHTGHVTNEDYTSDVSLTSVTHYWDNAAKFNHTQSFLSFLGGALAVGKQLRNENNYEGLLIAHEFRHPRMSQAFRHLAENMSRVAGEALRETGQAIAAYLDYRCSDPWEWHPAAKGPFVRQCVEQRIMQPVQEWYRKTVRTELETLLTPVLDGPRSGDITEVKNSEQDISLDLFGGKEHLMHYFETSIGELRALLLQP